MGWSHPYTPSVCPAGSGRLRFGGKSPAHDSGRSWRCASGTRRARERDDAAGEGGDRLPGGRWRKDARARAARLGHDAEQSRQSARRAAKKAVKPPAPPSEPRMPLRDRVRAPVAEPGFIPARVASSIAGCPRWRRRQQVSRRKRHGREGRDGDRTILRSAGSLTGGGWQPAIFSSVPIRHLIPALTPKLTAGPLGYA
jgi:hypothetical protein